MFGWLKGSGKTPAARRQELRDASRPAKGTTTEAAKSPLARRNTAPAFACDRTRGGFLNLKSKLHLDFTNVPLAVH